MIYDLIIHLVNKVISFIAKNKTSAFSYNWMDAKFKPKHCRDPESIFYSHATYHALTLLWFGADLEIILAYCTPELPNKNPTAKRGSEY